MAMANSVKLVEFCKIAPQPSSPADDDSSSSTQPPPESLPLTFFDLPWLISAPVQRLFFYKISNSDATDFFDSILIPKLKTSLSLTLQHFLPLAGNINWPQDSQKPILTYVQGDTISLTVARSDDADYFNHLISSSNDFVEAEEYNPLVPQLAISHEKAAAMALQVTIFSDHGFCIGTSMHHAILDGKSSTLFIKAWAQICKHDHYESNSLLPDELKPFLDRRIIRDPAGLEPIFLHQLLNLDRPNYRSLMVTQIKAPPPDSIRSTFVFTRTKIEALRQLVQEKKQQQHDPDHSVQYLSTFCLTCAYTWVCLVMAYKENIQAEEQVMMGFTVDCRSRSDPPIPANYLGNCLMGHVAIAEAKALLGEDAFIVAVNAISEAIKRLDAAGAGGVMNGAENWIPTMYSASSSDSHDGMFFSVAGSPRFRIYETDFGWGRPKKVEVVSIAGTGAMSLSESKDGSAGDVEVGLVLNKHHMQVFASLFAQGLANL